MSEATASLLSAEPLVAARDRAAGAADIAPGAGRSPVLPARMHGKAPWNIGIEIFSDLASVVDDWKEFEKSADCTPFQTVGWLTNWQRHIGSGRGTLPVVAIGRDKSGEILFILPLALETRKGVRQLTWWGVDLGDYNAPLLAPAFANHPASEDFVSIWRFVVALLQRDKRFRFDVADLPKMPEMVGAQKNPFLRLGVTPNRSGAYIATLGTNWDEYFISMRSASTRKTLRRKQKQLEAHGSLAFSQGLGPEASAQTLDVLIEQKSCAFARMGVENIFQRRGYPAFYRAVITDPETRDIVNVSRLDVGTTTAATTIALAFRQRFYLILSSYHAGELARSGPGRTLLHELLRHSIEHGFRQFDFTIGDEPYKLDWADTKLVLHDHLAGHTAPGWLVASAIMLIRRSIRFIKSQPLLWQIAVKVRSFISGRKQAAKGPAEDAE